MEEGLKGGDWDIYLVTMTGAVYNLFVWWLANDCEVEVKVISDRITKILRMDFKIN